MTKAELVKAVAAETDLTQAQAGQVLEALAGVVAGALRQGDKVALPGVGTFDLVERKARTGRNPQTGKPVAIAARKAPRFKAAKALKDEVQ